MQEHKSLISRRAFLGGAAAFGVASLMNPLTAFAAPTAAEKQAEADQVRLQVETLKAELVDKSNAYGAALDAHDAALAAKEQAQADIDAAQEKISALQDKLGTRAKSMYRTGASSFLDILFGATSFAEFATNWDILNRMNEDDATMVVQAKELREQLEAARNEYSQQEELAAEKMKEAKAAKEEIEKAADDYQAVLDTLDAETLALILQEQDAAAAAAATAQRARQQQQGGDSPSGSGGSNSSNGGGSGHNASDFGPPAGDLLTEAIKYIGQVPYVWGGASPETGFDCSGLVYYCCLRTGHSIPPRSTYGYSSSGWFDVSQAQPGDVLWQPEHVGICAAPGGTSYVHAANEQYGICYGSSPQFTRAYRF